MPKDYEKPVYVPNVDKYKSNAEKYREAERKAPPRQVPTDSDHTRMPQKSDEKKQG